MPVGTGLERSRAFSSGKRPGRNPCKQPESPAIAPDSRGAAPIRIPVAVLSERVGEDAGLRRAPGELPGRRETVALLVAHVQRSRLTPSSARLTAPPRCGAPLRLTPRQGSKSTTCRGVDAHVAIIPADAVARRRIPSEDLLDNAWSCLAVCGLGLGYHAGSRLQTPYATNLPVFSQSRPYGTRWRRRRGSSGMAPIDNQGEALRFAP